MTLAMPILYVSCSAIGDINTVEAIDLTRSKWCGTSTSPLSVTRFPEEPQQNGARDTSKKKKALVFKEHNRRRVDGQK
jgi:hypothetical protein